MKLIIYKLEDGEWTEFAAFEGDTLQILNETSRLHALWDKNGTKSEWALGLRIDVSIDTVQDAEEILYSKRFQ